ncbi:MAG: SDR family NAD(P)-dependent oxidoreductase [Burkholderiales bacterium]|nr:SDR family NAD(P)-dependent oxidoreductase [Burkholderiales bacterium]
MGTLTGRVAWVTGAGSGIGLAGAQALAAAGATVVLAGRRADVVEAEAAAIRASGGHAEAIALDVSEQPAVAAAAAGIVARHGALHILVNSAGFNLPRRYWKDATPADWDAVIRTNLDGAYYTTHAVLPTMRAQRDGLVIHISSWSGRFNPWMSGAAYNAAKHGVLTMTEHLNSEECVNGIRGCSICPAEVATPIMDKRPVRPSDADLARMLQPEDLGRTIRWVAEQPPHVCVNEILISPTWNRFHVGAAEIRKG